MSRPLLVLMRLFQAAAAAAAAAAACCCLLLCAEPAVLLAPLQVRWGQDDAGKLVVMDCREIDPSRVPTANSSNGAAASTNMHIAPRLP
jgi:hypothetical protein